METVNRKNSKRENSSMPSPKKVTNVVTKTHFESEEYIIPFAKISGIHKPSEKNTTDALIVFTPEAKFIIINSKHKERFLKEYLTWLNDSRFHATTRGIYDN